MTKYRWSMEGVANGTPFTTGTLVSTAPTGLNSTTVSNGTGSNASDNTHVHSGTQALKVTAPASSSQSYRLPFAAANNAAAVSMPFWLGATPSANFGLITLRHSAGLAARVQFNSAAKMLLLDTSGATIQTSTGSVTFGQWNVLDIVANTSTGAITANVRAAGSGTVDATATGSGASLSGNPLAAIDIGTPLGNGTGSTQTIWFDDIQMDDGATTEIGEYTAVNLPPVLNSITGNQNVSAGATVTATVSATDPEAGALTYLWSVIAPSSNTPTLTNSTTATVSFTAPAAGNLVTLQCVISDPLSSTVTGTTEVRVPSATDLVPLALNGTNVAGTMTNTGGAGTDGAALADASDSTYIESGTVSGTEQSERYRLQPATARSNGSLTPIRLATDTGTATAKVRIYEGSTMREQFSQAITSTPTDYTFALAGGTISAIADWGNLYLEVGFTT